ncbi:MAG TPA: hypothetical protein VFK04_02280 [Gemmatimonadaceae bacterium]|jgi:hypothetical protein|nr:hypothetical protein [Gemmatimonadaceae bacterium]
MTRDQLEHAIRAACDVADDTEVYVFGSQAILGQFPEAPEALRQSSEADLAPVHSVTSVDLIDAMLGMDSPFHHQFGFYVHGVPIEAAVLPIGWERRAILVQNANTNQMIGRCVEAHDLAASKLVAYREKDLDFVSVLLSADLVQPRRLRLRITQLPFAPSRFDEEHRALILEWLRGALRRLGRG